MKALPTQFDDRRLSSAVATPTCSSCCCCCCCLATAIASSSLLAQRIGREGEKHQIHNRHLLTVLAALFVPIVGALVYFGFWTINLLLKNCTEQSYDTSSYFGNGTYQVCTNPGAVVITPLLIIAPLLVLWFLYTRVHMEKPFQRAILVTALIAVAFIGEFFAGAALILTGVGGIAYLILVPVIVGWISLWYHHHIGKDMSKDAGIAAPSMQPAYPVAAPNDPTPGLEQITKQHDETPIKPQEPPQQNPPAGVAQ